MTVLEHIEKVQENLNSMVNQMDDDTDYYDATYHLEQIKEKAEQKSKTEWIPVSERLPEDRQRVLVTRKSGTIGYIMWNTWWHEQMSYPTDKVIAWMPLPEPYKESEDKE